MTEIGRHIEATEGVICTPPERIHTHTQQSQMDAQAASATAALQESSHDI